MKTVSYTLPSIQTTGDIVPYEASLKTLGAKDIERVIEWDEDHEEILACTLLIRVPNSMYEWFIDKLTDL